MQKQVFFYKQVVGREVVKIKKFPKLIYTPRRNLVGKVRKYTVLNCMKLWSGQFCSMDRSVGRRLPMKNESWSGACYVGGGVSTPRATLS